MRPDFAAHIPGGKSLFAPHVIKDMKRHFPNSDMFGLDEVEKMERPPKAATFRDLRGNRNLGVIPMVEAFSKFR